MKEQELNEKIDFVLKSVGGDTIEPKPNSVLSLVSSILIDPASATFHEGTKLVSDTLIKELNFYKEAVLPQVHELIELTENTIAEKVTTLEPILPVIKQIVIPEFIKILIERGTISKKEGGSLSDVNITLPMVDNIEEYINYGSGELGSYVKQFVSEKGVDFFKDVWNKYLNNVSLDSLDVFKIINIGNKFNTGLEDELFGLYILVKTALKNPVKGTAISLSVYENALINYEKKLATTIYTKAEQYINATEKGLVIVGKNETNIYVIDSNYLKVLEKGVNIESIFGTSLTVIQTYTVDSLVANKDSLENNWNNHYSLQSVKVKNSINGLYRMLIATTISKYNSVFVSTDNNVCEFTIEELNELTSKYMKTISNVTKDNVKDIIRNYVISVAYARTNASVFFSYVDTYTGKGYNLDLDRAIAFSMLEMIIDFYVNEVNVC